MMLKRNNFTKEKGENISEGRVQYVTNVAERIKEETIPEEWFSAEIVYICPVLGELEEGIIKRFEGSMIGVAPQGWLRGVGEGGRIEKKRWEKANEVLSRVDFVIVSEEVDANGAGDVFGAAFLLRYCETKDIHKAAIFTSCVASFVVEKEGVEGVPCREGVNERISMY